MIVAHICTSSNIQKQRDQWRIVEMVERMIKEQIFLWPCIHKDMEFFPLKCKESGLRGDIFPGGVYQKVVNIQIFDAQY